MAWIRLSDDYNDHPKFDNLSDGAFRLWHQAIGFCRKFRTDGLIPITTVRKFKAYSPKRARELETPWRQGEQPLWHAVDGFGIRVHDYLDWNPSKEEDEERRTDSRERMRILRERRQRPGVAPPVTPSVSTVLRANSEQTSCVTSHDVLGREGSGSSSGKGSGENPLDARLVERAGRLREELYPAWYAKWRHGARLRLVANTLEFNEALTLVQTWDDARLEKLARIVLTTDDPWISGTDRGFRIFAMKASWADDRLRQAEMGAA